MRLARLLPLSTVLGVLASASAMAQPYSEPPPGYYRGPGFHCEAYIRTPDGPRRTFCPIGGPAPRGSFCTCEGPPGFPPARGHVIR